MPRAPASPATRNSLTELGGLERELAACAPTGVARDDEELELGVRCMAAGIYDDQSNWWLACPSRRPPTGWKKPGSPGSKETAAQISSALGYRGC